MSFDKKVLSELIVGMRAAYMRGENAMAWARTNSMNEANTLATTLIAYDLQAGSYVQATRANPTYSRKWCEQLADLVRPYVQPGDRILEVGVGEATTLAGVVEALAVQELTAFGFDVSWSRIKVATQWLSEKSVSADLFVGDLFQIPMANGAVDVIYTSHSLEPNGGREREAIAELLRVARRAVVLVEPIYELASEQAKKRMIEHRYVQGLKSVAEELESNVSEYGLLDVVGNPLNPSGVLVLTKNNHNHNQIIAQEFRGWQCPLTSTPMIKNEDVFYAGQVGIAYPILRGIPLLRQEHAVIASKLLVD